ncbi:MAG: hypothetical protein K2Z81_12220, partial [Cyanobacteria bacterium]|nr:hypothetical protein [Cyanobacteriota bacterium]
MEIDFGREAPAIAELPILDQAISGPEAKLPSSVESDRPDKLAAAACSFASRNFRDLDLDGDGAITVAELTRAENSKVLGGRLSQRERYLLSFLKHHASKIAAASDDQTLAETKILPRDLTAFEKLMSKNFSKAIGAEQLFAHFGSEDSFKKLGTEKLMSKTSVEKLLLPSSSLSMEQRKAVEVLLSNWQDVVLSNNDQWGSESKVSLKDIQAYAKKNKIEDLTGFSVPNLDKPKLKTGDTGFTPGLPGLSFRELDLDGNGFLTRAELRKIVNSKTWGDKLSAEEKQTLRRLDSKLETICKASDDEFFKERRGVTAADLIKFEANQRRNQSDVPTKPGDHHLNLSVGGLKRDYYLHIPPGYNHDKPMPVVYAFHWFFGEGGEFRDFAHLNEKADKEGFIVV